MNERTSGQCRAEKDTPYGDDGKECNLSRRFFLRLELPAVLNKVALWQLDFLSEGSTHVIDDASQISASDVRLDDDATLHVLAVDRVRPLINAHFGNLGDWYFCSSGSVDQRAADRFDRLTRRVILEQKQHHRHDNTAFD
jgi:hypothetical protein